MGLWVPLPSLPHRTREALKRAPAHMGEAKKELRCGPDVRGRLGDREELRKGDPLSLWVSGEVAVQGIL